MARAREPSDTVDPTASCVGHIVTMAAIVSMVVVGTYTPTPPQGTLLAASA
jgi:hypothetical protein